MIDNTYYGQNQNPNQLQYNTVNPNAMSNPNALQALNPGATGVNGVSTQNVQTQNGYPQMQSQVGAPLSPPAGVATNVMPNNNLQTY